MPVESTGSATASEDSGQTAAARTTVDPSRRIEFLDVLRGLAALLVLVQHSVEASSLAFIQWTNRYINFGEVGVVVFFIVSGFIIPVSLEKYNSLRRFWVGRVLRLWPTYIASLIAIIILNRFLHQLPPYFDAHPARFIAGNLSMFEELLHVPLALGTYWTLSLELVFYIVCSVLFLFGALRRTRLWLALSAAILLLTQVALAIAAHKSLPAGRIGLLVTAFFGTLLYRYLAEHASIRNLRIILPCLLVVFAICFKIRFDLDPPAGTIYSISSPPPNALNSVLSWVSAYAIFLTVFAMRSRAFPRVLVWVGQISYPLYLFHGIVLTAVPRTLPWPVFLGIVAGLSLPIAHLVHVYLEKPVARFQHKLLPHKPILLPGAAPSRS